MSKNFCLPVFLSILALFCVSMLMISSVAPSVFWKQIIAWGIGIVLFFIGKQINPKQIGTHKWLIFVFCCILLILPILLDNITRGSRRWIEIGPINLQPSEIVKPLLMLYLSNSIFPFAHLLPFIIIMKQPDLGSALSILFLAIPNVLYNKKLFQITLLGAFALILVSPIIYNYGLKDYQKHRIINFINPNADPLGKGYKKGTQGQLLFLPEKHTDFMFATTAEELGLVGVLIIIVSYYFLIKTLFDKAYATTNKPLFIFTLGIAFQIWIQAFINIGMNIGIMPVTGIPLPFISVGGSSLMALMFSLGIIYSS